VLLACVRRGADPAQIQRLLRFDLDWERIVGDATRLGVAPLVYSTLKAVADCATVPPVVMERLGHLYYQQGGLNAQFYAELREILVACGKAGIPILVLKGAAVAERVYRNIALRSMKDLDLLVRQKDLEASDRLLRELGYVPDESYRPAAWYRDHHHHLAPYGAPDRRAVVELHHHIFPPGSPVRIPIEELWQRARSASIASEPALVLAPDDFLLHLCVDISSTDLFVGKLRALCDIAATVGRHGEGVEWAPFLEAARDYEAERFVYYPLWLAQRLAGAEIPTEVFRGLRSSVRRPSLQDSLLRSVTQRAVLRHQNDGSVIPAWVMSRACGDLLNARGTWGAIKALHPLDLLVRAVRHVVRRRTRR
jgi:hypothetical protein